MIGGRALDRAVVVWGDGQGSGVLLDRRTVLTAGHVLSTADGTAHVIHPSSSRYVPCSLEWFDEESDLALLTASADVIGAERAAPLGRIRFGRIATGAAVPHCDIVGFPDVQRYGADGLDLDRDHYRVSVLPMAGTVKGVLTCELDRPAADGSARATPPLAGLSGAPVLAGPVLLGVVTQVPQGRGHVRIEATPVEHLAARYAFLRNGFFENVTEVHPQDERFEARYAEDLGFWYRKTEIFGIEELGRSESRWDLDTAYLSLRAEAPAPVRDWYTPGYDVSWGADGTVPPVTGAWHVPSPAGAGGIDGLLPPDAVARRFPPSAATWYDAPVLPDHGRHADPLPLAGAQRIDALLTARPRVLLRGEAGAGKTTLVWWLAAHAANGTLGDDLAELNGLVPFVIPLREVHARGGRFPTVSDLACAGRVATDGRPEGWARRVLEARRGFLLVDGLDEVPAEQREEARRWLCDLLDRYPGTRCLATVRPNAVRKQWLVDDGFAELTLLPMSDDDIHAFVRAWHKAARLEGPEEDQLLTTLEQDLAHQLEQNGALRDLGRTPLLCAVICALHRRRRGLLPTTRWQLYRAALAMLLGGRDAGRGVRHADHITLDSEDQHALLQRLAIWLVRTGQQQMDRATALGQVGAALREMPHITGQRSPDRILRFLLDRSGLLQERADDAIQFIHRTFQDFLAAKEFHESGYLLELLEHARSETWEDVTVLAVGHAARPDAGRLIGGLLDIGDAAPERPGRYHPHVLAARCALNVQSLDPALMDRVRDRVVALLPPLDREEVEDLAGLGDWVVELVPDAQRLPGSVALHTVQLLGRVRSARSRRRLRQYAAHPELPLRGEVARAWDLQPVEEYVDEVLDGAHLPHLEIVDSLPRLTRLPRVGSVAHLVLNGAYGDDALDAHLPTAHLEHLAIRDNPALESLAFLRTRRDLRSVEVQGCSSARDLTALSDLGLTALRLGGGTTGTLAPHPGVRHLTLDAENHEWLGDLDAWPQVRALTIEGYVNDPCWLLRTVLRAPRLTRIALGVDSLHLLAPLAPCPRIERLMITGVQNCTALGLLGRLFPGLRKLALELVGPPTPVDVTGLHGIPDLELQLWGNTPQRAAIKGAEAFGDRLLCR
ncbi:NACHT domain-containing protein [Streptomyces longwoodensis]|uniref:NACHT domain-containing protein n=1 Tax=Streptomyces longwoodensis TaxID=68231 RepID=UPI0033FEC78E